MAGPAYRLALRVVYGDAPAQVGPLALRVGTKGQAACRNSVVDLKGRLPPLGLESRSVVGEIQRSGRETRPVGGRLAVHLPIHHDLGMHPLPDPRGPARAQRHVGVFVRPRDILLNECQLDPITNAGKYPVLPDAAHRVHRPSEYGRLGYWGLRWLAAIFVGSLGGPCFPANGV